MLIFYFADKVKSKFESESEGEESEVQSTGAASEEEDDHQAEQDDTPEAETTRYPRRQRIQRDLGPVIRF